MASESLKEIHLKDYSVPNYLIETTHLTFDLTEQVSRVSSVIKFTRNGSHSRPLVLVGQDLKLLSITLDGQVLTSLQYKSDSESVTIPDVPDVFELGVEVEIEPQNNTSLEGLYKSRTMFCTQCEAEGFRKITYYLDRPDVLSIFTTTVIADAERYPVLLSNGNLIQSSPLNGGRHSTTWLDPFPKPSYLFALVAGALSCAEDTFITASGRKVAIKLYVEKKDLNKCDHAITSLKNAMTWDEEVYGREYDLDVYMIVAVDDFNMGAMENKGLNIFNTSCVLANPDSTTDVGFQRVEAVVAHEYFHNWSGNRVTCRDWFQLSLKEGFTVFRDAEFSADMGSRTVKRVEDVQFLRTLQFAEDGGPMSHPVQPASFIEISNFYTLTVYEKGAEVVRMIRTLLGPELFRKGSDLYFDRHDGQAVTIDDFIQAMTDVSGRDFSLFMSWYRQAGTPQLHVSDRYDSNTQKYHLTIRQSCPSTPEAKSEDKKPFHIPIAMGLLGEAGALRLQVEGEAQEFEKSDNTHTIIELTQTEQTYVFLDIPEKPVPSLLREFSAPVKLDYNYSPRDLVRMMSADDDGFCRWNACQQLGVLAIDELRGSDKEAGESCKLLMHGYGLLLDNDSLDPAMVALMLDLPSEAYLGEQQEVIQVETNHEARSALRVVIAMGLTDKLKLVYHNCQQYLEGKDKDVSTESMALRSLQNRVLGYLMLLDDKEVHDLCLQQFNSGRNMTEAIAALTSLVNSTHAALSEGKASAFKSFYQKWQDEPLVVNQWLVMQAACSLPNTLDLVKALVAGPVFDINNPNKVRSIVGVFAGQNHMNFHRLPGKGYEFLADQILILNQKNPQVAARLLAPLTKWRRYDEERQALMRAQLQRIMDDKDLSKDVYEVVSKSLV